MAELLDLAISEGATLAGLRVEALKKRTQKQLLEVARKLDLSGVSKLNKDDLAARVLEALKASVRAEMFAHGASTEGEREAKDDAGSANGAAATAGVSKKNAANGTNGVHANGSNGTAPAKAASVPLAMTAPAPKKSAAQDASSVSAGASSTGGSRGASPNAGRATLQSSAVVATPGATSAATTAGEAPPLDGKGRAPAPRAKVEQGSASDSPGAPEEEPTARAKFDLGSAAKKAERPVENIPWGYGIDRVTAMPVDPERLFVYWEVTDEAIARARQELGAQGASAWLNLRVYDTTGRLFDGTNANSYFDHALSRDDRQWFFHIGRPHSTAFIDIGLKSAEGFFSRIARSGRVDFPRREQERDADVEWLTVRVATGHVESAGRGAPAMPSLPSGATPGAPAVQPGGAGGEARVWFEPVPLWMMRQAPQGGGHFEQRLTSWLEKEGGGGWHRVEWTELFGEGWFGVEGRVEWEGPLTVTSWEQGPFSYPVEVSEPTREEWQGGSFGYKKDGVMHVVYGPWQVVIRNLGAHYGRTVLSEWQVYRSWVVEAGHEIRALGAPLVSEGVRVPLGGSEVLYVGASERRWQVGSELRLMGASERFRVGASELRMRGASERVMGGASEWTLRGASERRFAGASELAFRGASESWLAGASERMYRGASERMGGSEGRLGGGSEARLGGSEGRLEDGGAEGEASGRYPKVDG